MRVRHGNLKWNKGYWGAVTTILTDLRRGVYIFSWESLGPLEGEGVGEEFGQTVYGGQLMGFGIGFS